VREEVERIARHDIKTPLNSIVSVPQMLREAGAMNARQGELLDALERSAYRILDMVNLSVDIYRMEQAQYRFQPRTVDLATLVDAVAREIRSHAVTKGVSIDIERRAVPVFAWAEELLCYSIVANLLKNAVEASPDGTPVSARFTTNGGVTLEIHNASEVPEAVRATFFEKYATAGKAGGFGLGTYSARLMARVQDGELTMQTSAQAGTTLCLRLRAAPPQAIPADASSPTPVAASARGAALDLPALRVLIVDDDEFNIVYLQNSLPSPPLVVETAINGRAAVDAYRLRPADIVFMDLDMPVMNGLEALTRIRAFEHSAGRRPSVVVAFSSFDDEDTRRRCAAAGFNHYVGKPASRAQIRELLYQVGGASNAVASIAPQSETGGAPGRDDPVLVDADVQSVLPGFILSRREIFSAMRQALEAGDRETLRRLAHKLVGGFALYGFRWAREESFAIERSAFEVDPTVLWARLDALDRHLDTVQIRSA
jgi:CheY-like chemotaxis protein